MDSRLRGNDKTGLLERTLHRRRQGARLAEASDINVLADDMAVHGVQDFLAARRRRHVEFDVQREQLKHIVQLLARAAAHR